MALRPIIEAEAIAWAVAFVEPARIDEINILNASIEAMHLALKKLKPAAEFILVDGNRFKAFGQTPFATQVKGDSRFLSIAAASVLAKTWRDEYMEKLHESFPAYQWKKNKGYPTADHRDAIRKIGACRHHRQSFSLLPALQTELFSKEK